MTLRQKKVDVYKVPVIFRVSWVQCKLLLPGRKRWELETRLLPGIEFLVFSVLL